MHSINRCKWNSDKRILTTPEDEEEANKQALVDAAWYKDTFGDFLEGKVKKGKGKKVYVDPENLYDLDGDESSKSIRQKPGSKPTIRGYEGSPGAPTFQVGEKQRKKREAEVEPIDVGMEDKVDDDADATDSVNYGNLTREELIELAKKLKQTSVSTKPTDSAPNSGSRSLPTSDEEESRMAAPLGPPPLALVLSFLKSVRMGPVADSWHQLPP